MYRSISLHFLGVRREIEEMNTIKESFICCIGYKHKC